MVNDDTINMLKECDSGSKMAVAAFDEVLDKVNSSDLRALLLDNKNIHSEYGNRLHAKLNEYGEEEGDENITAKIMSHLKINFNLMKNNDDKEIADLIASGCDMGVKSLQKYKNEYKAADSEAIKFADELIGTEEILRKELTKYL